jgi:hypothetical protein
MCPHTARPVPARPEDLSWKAGETAVRTFLEASVVVDGALADEREFDDGGDLDAWVDAVGREATAPTEVYVLQHTHPDDYDECLCAQYATSHRPYARFGVHADRAA